MGLLFFLCVDAWKVCKAFGRFFEHLLFFRLLFGHELWIYTDSCCCRISTLNLWVKFDTWSLFLSLLGRCLWEISTGIYEQSVPLDREPYLEAQSVDQVFLGLKAVSLLWISVSPFVSSPLLKFLSPPIWAAIPRPSACYHKLIPWICNLPSGTFPLSPISHILGAQSNVGCWK